MDDSAVLARCLAGDRDAFRELVEQYQSEAFGHAAAILGSCEEAQDAVQDAFLDAWSALPRFDSGRRFYPWFYTLLRHRCWKRISSRRRRREEELPSAGFVEASTSGHPADALALNQALRRLAAEERELILLRHLDGLSYEELARRLSIPQGTVMSRLFSARRKLRALLEAAPPPSAEGK